jgi:hypothetical protein
VASSVKGTFSPTPSSSQQFYAPETPQVRLTSDTL